MKIGHIWRS